MDNLLNSDFWFDIQKKRLLEMSFQSILYNVYTKPLFFPEIDTLAALDKSGLPISISSPVFHNLFGNNKTSDVLKSLNEKFSTHEEDFHSAMERAAIQADICIVERYSDIQLIIQVSFWDSFCDKIRGFVIK